MNRYLVALGVVGLLATAGWAAAPAFDPTAIAEAEAQVEIKRAEGVARANQIINQSLTREYLQHESNLALHKFAEKSGTATVVVPATMQTAPLINIPAGR